MVLSIDFDGVVIGNKQYPRAGRIKMGAKWAINLLARKNTIIINTCRSGRPEGTAQRLLDRAGIRYDYINQNCEERITFFKRDTRKISADIYLDDKNFCSISSLPLMAAWLHLKQLRFKKRPLIFAIIGKSGTGKSTLARQIEDLGIPSIDSYTERPPRHPDEGGHVFITKNQFSRLPVKDLLAITNVGGHRYCTLRSTLLPVQTYVVDVRGLDSMKRFDGHLWDVRSIYIERSPHLINVGEERTQRDNEMYWCNKDCFDIVIDSNGPKENLIKQCIWYLQSELRRKKLTIPSKLAEKLKSI